MDKQPKLESDRLVLRPFSLSDAADVRSLAGDREVAATAWEIPHPYEAGMAEAWIATHQQEFEEGKSAYFAITLQAAGSLIGSIGLRVNRLHEKAELGYWIGKPYWGNGYCTEAAMAVEDYCFEQLRLNRVYAFCTVRNHASARVLEKIGMSYEGHLRQALHRWGSFEDLTVFSILRSERIRQES